MNTQIEIFKPGKHTDVKGTVVTFSESDLKACASAYDPALYDAPLVVGHPTLEAPAYGWVKSISFAEGKLIAEPDRVDVAFAELVNEGRFSKVSASFYLPDAPNNPKPGVLYLKHIGFLGAAAPAIKGLKNVSFADSEQGVVEFADWDKMTIANLFRRFREYIIGKDGVETANALFPEYEINSLQINAAQDDDDKKLYFSETTNNPNEDSDMTPEQQAEFDALKAENTALKANEATLKTQVASFAEAEQKAKTEAAHADNVSFAEGLVKDGKLAPGAKDGAIALMDQLAAQTQTVEFGEGDAKTSMTPLAVYRKQLSDAPKLVEFGEHGGDGAVVEDLIDDPVLLAQKAVEYAESEAKQGRTVNSAAAVAHVSKTLRKH